MIHEVKIVRKIVGSLSQSALGSKTLIDRICQTLYLISQSLIEIIYVLLFLNI